MGNFLVWVARLAGVVGIPMCGFAAAVRVGGSWTFGGFQVGTIFLAGMGAMLLACLAYCAKLAETSGE